MPDFHQGELAFEQFAAFANCGLGQVPGGGILEVQLESLLDRENVSLDDADLAERLLAVHAGSSGAPVPSPERPQGNLAPGCRS